MKKHLLIASLLASLSATAAWAATPATPESQAEQQRSDDLMTHPAYPDAEEAPAKTASEAASSTSSEWGATPELLEEMPDDQ